MVIGYCGSVGENCHGIRLSHIYLNDSHSRCRRRPPSDSSGVPTRWAGSPPGSSRRSSTTRRKTIRAWNLEVGRFQFLSNQNSNSLRHFYPIWRYWIAIHKPLVKGIDLPLDLTTHEFKDVPVDDMEGGKFGQTLSWSTEPGDLIAFYGRLKIDNVRGHVQMMSAKFSDFLIPSPPCLHFHATSLTKLPLCICFWGTPPPSLPMQTSYAHAPLLHSVKK